MIIESDEIPAGLQAYIDAPDKIAHARELANGDEEVAIAMFEGFGPS